MSLLNDALKDLDRSSRGNDRQETVGRISEGADPLRSGASKRWALPAIAVLTVVVWLIVQLDMLDIMPSSNVTPQIPEPIAMNKKWLNVDAQKPIQAGVVEPVVAAVPTAEVVLATSEVSEVKTSIRAEMPLSAVEMKDDSAAGGAERDAIARLLVKADQAFAQDNLITPLEHNAYQLFRSVLLLAPSDPLALAGIEKIRQRYLELVEKAVQEQAYSTVEHHLQSAQLVGVSNEQIKRYRDIINKAPTAPAQVSTKRIRFDKDRDVAQRLRAHPLGQYENKAWLLIDSNEPSPKTAIALADAYAAHQNIMQLRKLADAVITGEPSIVAYVQAQLSIVNGDLASAASLLEAHNAILANDPHSLRLLAGVQAGLHDYERARPLYQKLTQMPDVNVNDWLGYAVALERVGESRDALTAYQKISHVRHNDRRINDYVQARIRDLAGKIDQ